MRKTTTLALLVSALSAPAFAVESGFDYNYFGFSYGMERIGIEGFSDEVAGHIFAADYSEEISEQLVYQFHIDKSFSEDSIYGEDSQVRVDYNIYNLHFGLGSYLPVTRRFELVGSAALGYTFYDNEMHLRVDGEDAIDVSDKGSDPYLRLNAGVRLFIEPSRSLEISPRILTMTTEDETSTYFTGSATFHLYNMMEIYGEMTTDLGDDYRIFAVGANMHY